MLANYMHHICISSHYKSKKPSNTAKSTGIENTHNLIRHLRHIDPSISYKVPEQSVSWIFFSWVSTLPATQCLNIKEGGASVVHHLVDNRSKAADKCPCLETKFGRYHKPIKNNKEFQQCKWIAPSWLYIIVWLCIVYMYYLLYTLYV